MLKRTVLHEAHEKLGARLVDFAGWHMPLSYGSQIEEHHAVRRHAGVFDVSHMTIVDVQGKEAHALLAYLLANDVGKLDAPGKALYSCMLREDGGVIDDLTVYLLGEGRYRLIANAATYDKDMDWISRQAAGREVEVIERNELALLALQGPNAPQEAAAVLPDPQRFLALDPFTAAAFDELFVARTGYTGEDGFEIMMPAKRAPDLWDALIGRGVVACGLAARDTLRLEAGMNLYGADMDETVSPLECGLGWTVSLSGDRRFIGREAIERQRKAGVQRVRVGLVIEDRGVLRAGYPVHTDRGEGVITSGSFGPTVGRSVALARVPAGASGTCEVTIRGRPHRARIVKPPFVRRGKVTVTL